MILENLDILIIGGGPIGLACGIAAKKANLRYRIIEKGCLVNSLYNYPLNMTFFSTSEKLEIGEVPFVSNNPKPTRSEALEYYRRVASTFALELKLFEEVKGVEKSDASFTVNTSKSSYLTKNIIVATGFYDLPNKINVSGEELPKVHHYYKDPHYFAYQDVVVIGASNSSVDAALETYRKGANVTMVVRESDIGQRVKYWVRPDIINRIKEGSIKAYFNSNVVEIKKREVIVQTPEGIVTLSNDFVLALTGYMPNIDFLRKLDINLSDDGKFYPQYNPDTMETNIEGVYLAGVVCGGMDTHVWFIENSRIHAEKIIEDISSKIALRSE